jgi:hypothetical protein
MYFSLWERYRTVAALPTIKWQRYQPFVYAARQSEHFRQIAESK